MYISLWTQISNRITPKISAATSFFVRSLLLQSKDGCDEGHWIFHLFRVVQHLPSWPVCCLFGLFGRGNPIWAPNLLRTCNPSSPAITNGTHTSSPELVVTLKSSKPTLQGLCDDLHCNSNVLLFLIFLEIF